MLKTVVLPFAGGFIAGIVANNLSEAVLKGTPIETWAFDLPESIKPSGWRGVGWGDILLTAIGIALAVYGILKQRWVLWFGFGWVIAQILAKWLE